MSLSSVRSAISRNAVLPRPVMNRQDALLNQVAPGEARTLMSQLLQTLKQREGAADLSSAQRARVQQAISQVHQFKPGIGARVAATVRTGSPATVQLNANEVRNVARSLGLALQPAGFVPVVVLSPESSAARYVKKLPVQPVSAGVGPVITRTYTERLKGVSADTLFRDLAQNFPQYPNPALSEFYKLRPGPLQVGDRLYIRGLMQVPADQLVPDDVEMAVRVKSIETAGDTKRLTLETLKGHFEAGQISFQVRPLSNGETELQVRSDARYGGRLSALAYPVVSKKKQEEVWRSFLARAAALHSATVVGQPELTFVKH